MKMLAVVLLGAALGGAPPPSRQPAGRPAVTALLVDEDLNAARGTAVVRVNVSGVQLIDPGQAGRKPVKGEGHLHYQLDDGPVLATTSTTMTFQGLPPGAHVVTVALVNHDHSPAGASQTLRVVIP